MKFSARSGNGQTAIVGAQFEDLAEQFLVRRGLKTLERNFSCRLGEIDLVMRDEATVVFAEVRYRRNHEYGGAEYSVDRHKQNRIIRAAETYLVKNASVAEAPCRFDVLAIDGTLENAKIHWIKDAFST